MGDDEFIVKCVKRTGTRDENDPGSGVQTAYDIMLENGFHPVWVEPAECLSVKERERNCVYIMDPFEGNAFGHLSSVGCRIFGPQCVLSCLHLKVGIPKTRQPIYSLSMKDLVISCTSLDKKTREDVMTKVQWMGGEVSKDFTDHVTHLVAGEVGSKKYLVAGSLGKHIMAPEWVEQVWKNGKNRHLHGTDEQFQKWKCPIFKNMVVTVSGLDSEKRKQVKSLVEGEGGSYSGEMKANECTHLIINEPKGQKYEFARKWKIQIVSLKWLTESVEKGYCQDEDQYRVELTGNASQRPQVSTSTPDKNKNGKGQRLSSMGDISSISHLPDLSHLNETAQSNVTRLQGEESDPLLELDLSRYRGDLFLDGCKIYLSGFRGPQMEKLKKILNIGGATRYNKINDSISHVIMGEKINADLRTIQKFTSRPHIVSTAWLIESLKQGKRLDEKQFYCVELPSMPSASPKQRLPKRPSHDTTTVKEATLGTDEEDREMAELMSQYMRQENDQTIQPEDQTARPDLMDNAQDVTQEPAAPEEKEQGIFSGKKFVFFGFEDDQQFELSSYIEDQGGKILTNLGRHVCDYAVVPIGGYPVTVTVTEVVTNAWLQMCLEQEELLPVNSNELFQPLEVNDESSPLDGCVLSISGFAGTERDCLMHIAEVLGARCQEYFVRKASNKDSKGLAASTHLVTKEAEGSKYTAAKKWNLPAVSKQWLFTCARSGKREPEANFLIDNVKSSSETTTSPPQESAKSAGKEKDSGNAAALKEPDITKHIKTNSTKLDKSSEIEQSAGNAEKTVVDQDIPKTDISHNKQDCELTRSDKDMDLTECPPNDMETECNIEEIPPQSPRNRDQMVLLTEVSPPSGSSQKENINDHVTPVVTKPQHGRLMELVSQGVLPGKPRTPGTAARMGIDTPSKFLNPEKAYMPNFDLNDLMSAVQSPVNTNTPGNKKSSRRRKSSLPLDEALQFHMSQAMKISTSRKADNTQRKQNDDVFDQFPVIAQNLGPLRDVVISVSKKLSNHQAEYNNIAASLGADYRWTYDSSCTHYIFQGRPNDTNREFRTARDQGKVIVSPHWLTMCKEQNARVDEKLFPHNYNPNLTLSVVSSKRETPARSTRKSSRSTVKSQSDEQSKTDTSFKPRSLAAETVPMKTRKQSERNTETLKSDVEKSPPKPTPAEDEDREDAAKLPVLDTGGTLEIREAFNKEIESIMATTKTKKAARRKSRRLNSNGQLEGSGETSSAESINKARPVIRNQPRPPPEHTPGSSRRRSRRSSKHWEHCHSEPSQSVQVTWDDETGRLEQERLAVELQRAHSPTQCSQAYPLNEQYGENAQFSDQEKDESMEIQLNIKPPGDKKAEDFRTPTPEPPALGFPVQQSNQNDPEPVELIEEELEKEGHEEPPPPPPVFIVSGMQQQERDDYGALVEQLGGRMLEGQHYDASCTHLVVGNPTRNEKFLACVASGKWVLHKSYFEACRQEGRFVDEEVHEWGSDGTRSILSNCSALTVRLAVAAHRWRIRIQDNIKANLSCRGAFEGWKVVLCTDKNKEENFKRLLEAGGAQVVATRPPFASSLEATHAFLDLHKIKLSQEDLEKLLQEGVNCLRPDYIAAFLTEDPAPNPDECCPTEILALKASLSVPDQALRKRKASSTGEGGKKSRRL